VRWTLILLALCTLAAVAFVASAKPSGCTWTGTPHRDIKTGSGFQDELCSKGGPDFIHGAGGNDSLEGGNGRDVAVGGGGRDQLYGGKGNDRLFAVDDRGGEKIYGGPGVDQCFVDPADQVSGCERTFRSTEVQMAQALSRSLQTVMEVAENGATVTETITIGATIPPVTVTKTVTLPPCNQGPPEPPPFCGGG
jgi:RTX calcium-binding nonapeptide repeat (4 copies)